MSTVKTRALRTVGAVREVVADMNYAQRRLLETKLGMPAEGSALAGSEQAQLEELEALYRLGEVS